MKTPLVIVLVIVAGMLGFLTIYSQQHEMVAAVQEQGAAGGYGGAPAAGGYGAPTPAAGGNGK